MVETAAAGVVPTTPGGEFTAKKTPGCKRARGDQSHDGDEAFEQHGPIADRPRIPFARDHFRRGAGRDQRMKSRNRAASDGDEDEGKHFAGEDGTGAVDEAREGRELQRGMHQQDADGQHRHDAQFDERAQIIARGEEQPHRQHAGKESVDDHRDGQRRRRKREPGREHAANWPRPVRRKCSRSPARVRRCEHSSTLPGRQ